MAVAGYRCAIRRGGVPTSTVSEPFTLVTTNVYQITSVAKRAIDPTQPWHITNAGATVSYASIGAFDFLFGEVTIPGVTAAIRFTGTFIPLTTASEFLSEVKSHSLSESSDLLDTTVYSGGTNRTRKRINGLADASISLDMNLNVVDMGSLSSLHKAGATVLLEINTGASPVFRGFGKIESIDRSGSVDGLVEASVSWMLAAERDSRTGFIAGYSERSI